MLIRGFNYGSGGSGAGSNGPANAIQTSDGAGGFVGESEFSYDPVTNTVALNSGTQVADNPALNISQTWNNGAVAFTGLKFNVTDTASSASSLLLQIQRNGTNALTFSKDTLVCYGNNIAYQRGVVQYATTYFQCDGVNAGIVWNNGSGHFSGIWYDGSAGALGVRQGANSQQFRIYNTYTDASNYERLAILPGAASGWMQIAAQTAGTGVDNIWVALSPAGQGGISARVANGATSGGNTRGGYCVDLQTAVSAATQVASGLYSVISGGTANTASGIGSTVSGGSLNAATNIAATVAGGELNIASGQYSAVSGGTWNVADGIFSFVMGGRYATTRGLSAARAYSGNRRSSTGDAQIIGQPARATTSSVTPATLTSDGGAVGSANVMVLPNNSSAHFRARVCARNATSVGSGSWEICGTIERGANAASTAIVGATTIRAFGISASLGAPTVDVIADTTQGAAVIQVTAGNSDTTYWVGDIELIQVA